MRKHYSVLSAFMDRAAVALSVSLFILVSELIFLVARQFYFIVLMEMTNSGCSHSTICDFFETRFLI